MKKLTFAVCMLMSSAVFAGDAAQSESIKGDAAAGKTKSAPCMACHGADGNSPTDAFPKIAGQGEKYLIEQLEHFKSGKRNNALMASQVANLSEQDMADLAAYYAQSTMSQGIAKDTLVTRGGQIFRGGDKSKNIPACMACHGPSGAGMASAGYPRVGGQHAAYVAAQIVRYGKGDHSGDAGSKMMEDVAKRMNDADIEAVSSFIAGLK